MFASLIMDSLKTKWYKGEWVALDWYIQRWYCFLDKNFTIRGGEIDLIVENESFIVFIEVKVVDSIEEWSGYLSARKLQAIERSIEEYCYRKWIEKEIRLDLVFVKNQQVIEVFENISNS